MGPRSEKPLRPADIRKALEPYRFKTYKCGSACCTFETWAIGGSSVQLAGPCGQRLRSSYPKSRREVASEVVARVVGQCPTPESRSADKFCRRVDEIEALENRGVGD